jgi:hypothetical protein
MLSRCFSTDFILLISLRLTDNIVALKEIRLEHEEGAPCTAIREGKYGVCPPVTIGILLMSGGI